MKAKFSHLFFASAISLTPAYGQVRIETTFSVGADVQDRGQFVDVRTLANTGLSSILNVDVNLVLSGANGTRMRFGDLYATLTHGTASEDERVSVLLNRVGANDTTPWGSSLSSLQLTLDDSAATNVYHATSGTGTYAADGRISVNPYATPIAYDSATVTAGLSALNGEMLTSNKWSLLIADVRQGAASRLDSWTLKLTGTAASTGAMNLGEGGKISDFGGSDDTDVKATFQTAGTGNSGITADVSQNLTLSGGLNGSGDLNKTGLGTLVLSGSSTNFNGSVVVSNGAVEIASSNALGANSNLRLTGNGARLTLANAASLSANITLGAPGMSAELNGSGTLAGAITGDGGLRKTGSGTISLEGNANFTGATEVEAGALVINGTLSGSNGVSVSNGASLMGSGTVNVSTAIFGTHAAGNSPGLQTFTDGLSYGSTATILWDFEGNDLAIRGTDYDAIDVTGGDLSIASGAVLKLVPSKTVNYSASQWLAARSFTVISFSGGGLSSGMFALDSSLDGGSGTYGSWLLTSESGSVVLNWTPIPEPGITALMGSMAMLILIKRRR